MKTIYIDLNTIKENPNRFRVRESVIGSIDVSFSATGKEIPKWILNSEDIFITSESLPEFNGEGKGVKYEGKILYKDEEQFNILHQKMIVDCGNLNINKNINRIDIDTIKQPSHFFSYQDTEVKCNKCKKTFMSSEFKEMDNDSDDFAITYTGCPKCGEWDCCEVKYEDLTSALKRMEKLCTNY